MGERCGRALANRDLERALCAARDAVSARPSSEAQDAGRPGPLWPSRPALVRRRSRSVADANAFDHHITPRVHALVDDHPAPLAVDRASVTTMAPERRPGVARVAEPDRAGGNGRTQETRAIPIRWPDHAPFFDPALFNNDAPLTRRAEADLLVKAEVACPRRGWCDQGHAAEGECRQAEGEPCFRL